MSSDNNGNDSKSKASDCNSNASPADIVDHSNQKSMLAASLQNAEMQNNSSSAAVGWWFVCDFSQEELFILRSSFGALRPRLENIAVMAFTLLFDRRPDAFAVFIGKKVLPSSRDDVAYSWETKQHGLRVLSVVEKCLNRMDRWDLFEDVVSSLAARHLNYGAKPVYILALFGCLREALLSEMENHREHEAADQNQASSPQIRICGAQYELGISAINSAWNKFFRTLGLALVAQMLTLQEGLTDANGLMDKNGTGPTHGKTEATIKKSESMRNETKRSNESGSIMKAVSARFNFGTSSKPS